MCPLIADSINDKSKIETNTLIENLTLTQIL